MRNNPILTILIFSAILFVIDFYSWWGIRKIIVDYSSRFKKTIKWLFWGLPIFIIVGTSLLFSFQHHIPHNKLLSVFNVFSGAFVLLYPNLSVVIALIVSLGCGMLLFAIVAGPPSEPAEEE